MIDSLSLTPSWAGDMFWSTAVRFFCSAVLPSYDLTIGPELQLRLQVELPSW